MPSKRENKRTGRRSLAIQDDDSVVMVGVKMPKSLEDKIKMQVKILRRAGFRCTKSELIRVLAEYWLSGSMDIYQEKRNSDAK